MIAQALTKENTTESYPYNESRRCVRLLRYWQEKRGIRTMPEENDIDPEDIGADWDYCFLLQSRDIHTIKDYNFTYLGKKILAAYQEAALDAQNGQMLGPNAHDLSNKFDEVLSSASPILEIGELVNYQAQLIRFRQILLPLGTDSDAITAIFGGMSYQIVK